MWLKKLDQVDQPGICGCLNKWINLGYEAIYLNKWINLEYVVFEQVDQPGICGYIFEQMDQPGICGI